MKVTKLLFRYQHFSVSKHPNWTQSAPLSDLFCFLTRKLREDQNNSIFPACPSITLTFVLFVAGARSYV